LRPTRPESQPTSDADRTLSLRYPHSLLRNFRFPVVIFGNATGDHLLALPAFRALASLFPSRLSIVCMPGFRRTFFSGLPVRSILEIKMSRKLPRTFNAASAARRIGKCDLLISINPWRSVSLDGLVGLVAPDLSIGFSPAFRIPLRQQFAEHATAEAFRVPARINPRLRLTDFAYPLRLPPQVRPRIREFLRAVAPGKRILTVHNETKSNKVWPRNRMRRLLRAFLERHPDFVVFILNFKKPNLRLPDFKDRIIHSRRLPLLYAFGVVRECDLFLGADSSMLHAADMFRVPGVGLFGPTDPRRYGFRFAHHRHVRNRRGMRYIRESAVLAALESLLR